MAREKLFVHVNDSIRKLANAELASQTLDFVCECPEVACRASVSLTLSEFDERRAASPALPILAAGHTA